MVVMPTEGDAPDMALADAVTLDDVSRVAEELLDPEGLHFVVVGQPVGLESSVAN